MFQFKAALLLFVCVVTSTVALQAPIASTYSGQIVYALLGDTLDGHVDVAKSTNYAASTSLLSVPGAFYTGRVPYASSSSVTNRNPGVATNRDTGQYVTLTSTGGLFLSTDFGVTWASKLSGWITTSSISANGQYMRALCYDCGLVYISSNFGSSWVTVNYGHGNGGGGVSMSDSGQHGILCYYFGVMVTHDYGVTWADGAGFDNSWTTYWTWDTAMSASGQYAFVISFALPSIWTSSDYGNTWHRTLLTSDHDVTGNYLIDCSSDGRIVVVESTSNFWLSSDFGETWSSLSSYPAVVGGWDHPNRGVSMRGNGGSFYTLISNHLVIDSMTLAGIPGAAPTPNPSHSPSEPPTHAPTAPPTRTPTHPPTHSPSEQPTRTPSAVPTHAPTAPPTGTSTAPPTHVPPTTPSESGSSAPTSAPTYTPEPTNYPTSPPTCDANYAILTPAGGTSLSINSSQREIGVTWTSSPCASSYVFIELCVRYSLSEYECVSTEDSSFILLSHNVNDGADVVFFIEWPATGSGFYLLRVVDAVHRSQVGESEAIFLDFPGSRSLSTSAPTCSPVMAAGPMFAVGFVAALAVLVLLYSIYSLIDCCCCSRREGASEPYKYVARAQEQELELGLELELELEEGDSCSLDKTEAGSMITSPPPPVVVEHVPAATCL